MKHFPYLHCSGLAVDIIKSRVFDALDLKEHSLTALFSYKTWMDFIKSHGCYSSTLIHRKRSNVEGYGRNRTIACL